MMTEYFLIHPVISSGFNLFILYRNLYIIKKYMDSQLNDMSKTWNMSSGVGNFLKVLVKYTTEYYRLREAITQFLFLFLYYGSIVPGTICGCCNHLIEKTIFC